MPLLRMPYEKCVVVAVLVFVVAIPRVLPAGEGGLVSTMSLVAAVENAGGIHLAPALDVPGKRYTEDLAPPQVLEIIRPNQGPVTVGRLFTSCTCLSASLPKKSFAQGERIFVEVRNVKPTVAGGAKYAVFVQLTSPVNETLQYDVFVKSERRPAPAKSTPPAAETAAPRPRPAAPPAAVDKGTTASPGQPASKPVPTPPPFTYEDITPYRPRP